MTEESETATSRRRRVAEFIGALPVFVFAGIAATLYAIHKFYHSKWMDYLAGITLLAYATYAVVVYPGLIVDAVEATPRVLSELFWGMMPELAIVAGVLGVFAVIGMAAISLHEGIDAESGESTLRDADEGDTNE